MKLEHELKQRGHVLMVPTLFSFGCGCYLSFKRLARRHVGSPGQLQYHGEGAEAALQHAERGRWPLGKSHVLFLVLTKVASRHQNCLCLTAEGGD